MVLAMCLPSCTTNNEKTSSQCTSTKPFTTPTGNISTQPTSPTYTSRTALPPGTPLEPVNMPPDMTGRISEMLKYIPYDTEGHVNNCYFVDFDSWGQTFGINPDNYRSNLGYTTVESENKYIDDLILSPYFYSSDTPRSGWSAWLGRIPFISGMGSMWNLSRNQNIIKEMPIRTMNIGYGPLDIERSIVSFTVFSGKPDLYEAINGVFSTTAIDQSAKIYQDDNHYATTSIYNGVNIYSWDENRIEERKLDSPVFDIAGDGATLAVQEHEIFGRKHAGAIDSMVDASQGKIKSLADDPLFQEMANKLELMGTMSVTMYDDYLGLDYYSGSTDEYTQQQDKSFKEAALTAPLLGPYSAHAVGLAADERGLFVSIILVYETPAAAKSDITTLKERLAAGYNMTKDPWSKEVTSSEVWAEENMLCAKLYGQVTYYWDRFLFEEPLLVRGDG